jgi:hypothetical protein
MDDAAKSPEFRTDCSRARNAPPSTDATRIALVSFQLGLSEEDLEAFYYVRRKGSKNRHFNYARFSDEYGVSLDWLYHGYLPEHPRHLKLLKKRGRKKRPAPKPVRKTAEVAAASAADDRLPFIVFMERLGAHVVKEFDTGKRVDEIFDELITDAIQKSRTLPPLPR